MIDTNNSINPPSDKLCDFIKSKPRPEFMNEIDDILWFTEHF